MFILDAISGVRWIETLKVLPRRHFPYELKAERRATSPVHKSIKQGVAHLNDDYSLNGYSGFERLCIEIQDKVKGDCPDSLREYKSPWEGLKSSDKLNIATLALTEILEINTDKINREKKSNYTLPQSKQINLHKLLTAKYPKIAKADWNHGTVERKVVDQIEFAWRARQTKGENGERNWKDALEWVSTANIFLDAVYNNIDSLNEALDIEKFGQIIDEAHKNMIYYNQWGDDTPSYSVTEKGELKKFKDLSPEQQDNYFLLTLATLSAISDHMAEDDISKKASNWMNSAWKAFPNSIDFDWSNDTNSFLARVEEMHKFDKRFDKDDSYRLNGIEVRTEKLDAIIQANLSKGQKFEDASLEARIHYTALLLAANISYNEERKHNAHYSSTKLPDLTVKNIDAWIKAESDWKTFKGQVPATVPHFDPDYSLEDNVRAHIQAAWKNRIRKAEFDHTVHSLKWENTAMAALEAIYGEVTHLSEANDYTTLRRISERFHKTMVMNNLWGKDSKNPDRADEHGNPLKFDKVEQHLQDGYTLITLAALSGISNWMAKDADQIKIPKPPQPDPVYSPYAMMPFNPGYPMMPYPPVPPGFPPDQVFAIPGLNAMGSPPNSP